MLTGDESGALAVSLARVEGKIDAYAARTTAVEEKVAEIDRRLRLAASEDDVHKIDERVRSLESRPVVTPMGLVATLASTVAVMGGFVAMLDRLYT